MNKTSLATWMITTFPKIDVGGTLLQNTKYDIDWNKVESCKDVLWLLLFTFIKFQACCDKYRSYWWV